MADVTTNTTPNTSDAGANEVHNPQNLFEALLRGDQNVEFSPEELQNAMKLAKKLLAQKQNVEAEAKEKELAPQLQEYENQLEALRKGIEEADSNFKARMEALKTERKDTIARMGEELQEFLKTYNAKREELGLKPKSMRGTAVSTGTRISAGKQHKYDIDWADDEHKSVKITVDETYSEVIPVVPNPSFKTVKQVLENAGLEIGQGGKVRGVINRIRDMKTEAKIAANS